MKRPEADPCDLDTTTVLLFVVFIISILISSLLNLYKY